jgi:hypothetical protein
MDVAPPLQSMNGPEQVSVRPSQESGTTEKNQHIVKSPAPAKAKAARNSGRFRLYADWTVRSLSACRQFDSVLDQNSMLAVELLDLTIWTTKCYKESCLPNISLRSLHAKVTPYNGITLLGDARSSRRNTNVRAV